MSATYNLLSLRDLVFEIDFDLRPSPDFQCPNRNCDECESAFSITVPAAIVHCCESIKVQANSLMKVSELAELLDVESNAILHLLARFAFRVSYVDGDFYVSPDLVKHLVEEGNISLCELRAKGSCCTVIS